MECEAESEEDEMEEEALSECGVTVKEGEEDVAAVEYDMRESDKL